ncbi:MAG: tRNA-wybutosine modification methyltransferase TYW3 [Candidatus Woesearchaeota archaeon]
MDYFTRSKASVLVNLKKIDKSRKGDVDFGARPVVDAFNNHSNYYTTSSCSGRISVFRESKSRKKFDSGWVFVKHGTVTPDEILSALKSVPLDTLWFRQESPIFHVACNSLESASSLLELCRDLGFKHSGIIGAGRRFMVEIIFNEKMDCPISENSILYLSREHLNLLILKANEKLLRNNLLLKKLAVAIKKL